MEKPYSCEWEIIHVCNYRCPYCPYPWEAGELKDRHKGCGYDDLVGFWKRIFEKHGAFEIRVSGGEPSVHPRFIDLLSEIGAWHKFTVVTNLAWDAKFARTLSPAAVTFHPSFHPHFAEIKRFAEKTVYLKDRGFRVVVKIVAYPPVFDRLEEYGEVFRRSGTPVRFHPFFGDYGGRAFPASYSPAERDWLRRQSIVKSEAYDIGLGVRNPRGMLCGTGNRYFRLYPDGNIYRCSQTNVSGRPLGNVKDADFSLFDGATPCPADQCYCGGEYYYLQDIPSGGFFKPPSQMADGGL